MAARAVALAPLSLRSVPQQHADAKEASQHPGLGTTTTSELASTILAARG
jgi:hypothetical protein